MEKGQIGISTLMIFIVIIIVAALAAVVMLQAASSLKETASQTEESSRTRIVRGFLVLSVDGVRDLETNNPNLRGNVKYLWITATLSPGSDPINLTKTKLTFRTYTSIVPAAKYIDADGSEPYGDDACSTTLNDVNTEALDAHNGEAYTVAWLDCAGIDNSTTVFPKQRFVIVYRVPDNGLSPGTYFELRFLFPGGATDVLRYYTPETYVGKYITIYP